MWPREYRCLNAYKEQYVGLTEQLNLKYSAGIAL